MKKFFIFVILVVVSVILVFKFYGETIIKSQIEKNLSKSIDKNIKIQNIFINYHRGEFILKNIDINHKNSDDFINIDNLLIHLNLRSLLSETIEINQLMINNINLKYIIELPIEKLSQNKINDKNIKNSNNKVSTDSSDQNKSKNFNISQVQIDNVYINAVYPKFNIDQNFELKNINLKNVGNSNNSNDFREIINKYTLEIFSMMRKELMSRNLLDKLDEFKNLNKQDIEDEIKEKLKNKLKNKLQKLKIF